MKKLLLALTLFLAVSVGRSDTTEMAMAYDMAAVDTSENISGRTLADIRFAEITADIEKARIANNRRTFPDRMADIFSESIIPICGMAIPVLMTYFIMLFFYKIKERRYELMAKYVEHGQPVPGWLTGDKEAARRNIGSTYLVLFIVFAIFGLLMFIGVPVTISQGHTELTIAFSAVTIILFVASGLFFKLYHNQNNKRLE